MSNNLNLVILLAFLTAFGINTLEAQTKSDKPEKKVIIIKKIIDENGKETVERIEASGTDADKYLKTLESMEGVGEHIDIDVEVENMDPNQATKKYKMLVLDENGKEKQLEWNGEGEMPKEMNALIEKHDIDVHIAEEDGEEMQKVVMKFVDEEGNEQNMETEDVKIKRTEVVNKDGSKSIQIEVNADNIDDSIEKSVEVIVQQAGSEDEEVIVEIVEENTNKAQLGVMIENAKGGVGIKGFAPDSSAKAAGLIAGDIITHFNGTAVNTIQALVEEVGKYQVGDVVKVQFVRGPESMEKEITLDARTGDVKKKFKWKQAGQQ